MDDEAERHQRRVALLLEYDGGRYAGSQYQENVLTVQAVLEESIERVTSERPRVAFAGRTDAGVHSYGQVASFLTSTRLETPLLRRALNAVLPHDIAVREAVDVDVDFDPRRQATRRHYRYLVTNDPIRGALDRDRAWHVHDPLDCRVMLEAAAGIVGRHDFRAFAAPLENRDASTVRELYRFDVTRDGKRITFDVTANAFLPHQVRRMVGALVEVGKGKLTSAAYVALLDAPTASAGPVAPAHALYLMRVEYPTPVFQSAVESEIDVW